MTFSFLNFFSEVFFGISYINLLSFYLELRQSCFCCLIIVHTNLLIWFSIESFCFQRFIINFIETIILEIEKYLVCISKWSSPILNVSSFIHCRYKILLIEQGWFLAAVIKVTIVSYIHPAYIIIKVRGRELISLNSKYLPITFGLHILLHH